MLTSELKLKINGGALSAFSSIYSDVDAQRDRYLNAIDKFGTCKYHRLSFLKFLEE